MHSGRVLNVGSADVRPPQRSFMIRAFRIMRYENRDRQILQILNPSDT
jgi:hypothetical protein